MPVVDIMQHGKQRNCTTAPGTSSAGDGTPGAGTLSGRRGTPAGRDARRRVPMEKGDWPRRAGCPAGQATHRPADKTVRQTVREIGETVEVGALPTRLGNGPVDPAACRRIDRASLWRRLRPVRRLACSPSARLELPKARSVRPRAKRSRRGPVAPRRLAAHKNARCSGRSIVFLDESGFMLHPVVRRTWALRGQTPVLACWDRHERLSVISCPFGELHL